jgi:glycosidase
MKKITFLFKNLTALALFIYSGFAMAQNTGVTFMVNMNYQITQGNFNPQTQSVDIAGSFNNWGANLTTLSDTDSDGIYTTVVSLPIGTTIQFKTRINGQWDGTEEFAGGGPNRNYTVMPDGVVQYWYNDVFPENALDARISASAYVVQPGQEVQFFDTSLGSPVSWEWTFTGGSPETSEAQNPIVSYTAAGSYAVTLTVTNTDGESMTRTFNNYIRVDEMQTHWWNDRVFYEVFVRSFKDSNGDGKGDLQGLIDKLDYLNDGNPETTTDLGITGIWLMPIQKSPSYHGYDVTDYMAVEEDYGNNPLFQQFMTEAHNRGIKVIIDMVMNHTSNEHPWFVASQSPGSDKRDWYIWEDTNPGTPGPFEGNPWHNFNGDFYYGAFWSGMPDLNFYNEEVHEAFEEITEFWLNDMGVDGFRLDAVKFLHENGTAVQNTPETLAYWQEFRAYYKSVNPDAFAVGEAWDLTSIANQYVNNNGLDYVFEFETADAMLNALNSGNATNLKEQMVVNMQSYPFLQFGTMLTNHDTDRVMSVLGNDVAKAKAAATLYLTLPGIPYIYYGEEIGMTGVKPDPQLRTPMQWTGVGGAGFTTGAPWHAINTDYTVKNVAAQQANTGSLWHHYRKLIEVRHQEETLRRGTYLPVTASSDAVFAFIRQHNGQNILVAVNVGGSQQDVALAIPQAGLEPGNHMMYELLDGSAMEMTAGPLGGFESLDMVLPARGYKIYKIDNALSLAQPQTAKALLYPNPAKGSFSITTPTEKVELYNTKGQLITTYKGAGAHYSYSTEGLAKGIYMVKVKTATGQSNLKLVIE